MSLWDHNSRLMESGCHGQTCPSGWGAKCDFSGGGPAKRSGGGREEALGIA